MQTAVIESGPARGWLDDALDTLEPDEALPPGRNDRIGVVFVHGIGSQRPGETLLDWSRPLVRLVSIWSARHGGPYHLIRRASIDFTGTTLPYLEIGLPGSATHPEQTWVMTEAWWAAQVRPPSIGEMRRWLLDRGQGWRMLLGVAGGIGEGLGLPLRWANSLTAQLVLGVAFLAAALLYLLSRVLRIVPIGWLRRGILVRSFDYFLGDWFGDVRIMLLDRAQAASVRSRLRRAIYALRAYGCGPIVLVAHSGGTFVSYMTLVERSEASLPATRLITHGQALNLVWNLGQGCEANRDATDDDRLQVGDPLLSRLTELRPGLDWVDFHATHDPAPVGGFGAGGCVVDRPGPAREHLVHNRGSVLADHGGYWENTEEFVLPLARLIETADPRVTTSRLFAEVDLPTAKARRAQRVAVLSLTKTWVGGAAVLSALLVGPLGALADGWFGRAPGNAATLGREVLPGLSAFDNALATIVGVAVALLAFVALLRSADTVWDRWDEAHRLALVGGSELPEFWPMLVGLGLCGTAAVAVIAFVAAGRWWLLVVAAILAIAAIVLSMVSTRRPPPATAPPSVPIV